MSSDRIERSVLLQAPRSRIWRALTDIEQFNSWFGVRLEGQTFVAGRCFSGGVTYPGYENVRFEVNIVRCEPEEVLSWRWHPAANDPKADYTQEPMTLVEFHLRQLPEGTLLTVVESGLDQIPVHRRLDVFRLNSQGWDDQLCNLREHVHAG